MDSHNVKPAAETVITPNHTLSEPPNSPLTLLNLPSAIQEKILQFLLVRCCPIHPLHRTGTLRNGPWSSVSGEDIIYYPNIDIAPFLICKSFSSRAISIFYTFNTFSFCEAAVAKDFLTRFIHLVCYLEISMSSGYVYTGSCPTMEQPQERQWLHVFNLIRLRHQNLQSLKITFWQWLPVHDNRALAFINPQKYWEHVYIKEQRMMCIETLKLLSVRHVTVREYGGRFMSARERHELALLMQQRKRTRGKWESEGKVKKVKSGARGWGHMWVS